MYVSIVAKRVVNPMYGLTIDYPQVVALPNRVAQQRINERICKEVNALFYRHIQQLQQQGITDLRQMEVVGTFEIKTNQRDVLSLTVSQYVYVYPSAHGLTFQSGLTFDVTSGKCYQLEALFKEDSDYVSVLSDLVSEQIAERDISVLEPFETIRPDQDYYIADKCLVLFFQIYEITAYVYGFPYFPISVYEIEGLIKEDSPLAKMIG